MENKTKTEIPKHRVVGTLENSQVIVSIVDDTNAPSKKKRYIILCISFTLLVLISIVIIIIFRVLRLGIWSAIENSNTSSSSNPSPSYYYTNNNQPSSYLFYTGNKFCSGSFVNVTFGDSANFTNSSELWSFKKIGTPDFSIGFEPSCLPNFRGTGNDFLNCITYAGNNFTGYYTDKRTPYGIHQC
jgi:hypothetical protein